MRKQITAAKIAWAAGLFEGEGCISIKPGYQDGQIARSLRLVIQITDRDVLERFCEAVECGSVRLRRPEEPGKKAVYSWEIGNRPDVERLMRAFLPWLGERRSEKARLVLAECAAFDRDCVVCGVRFRGKRSDTKCCSDEHRHVWQARQYRRRQRLAKAAA